MKERDKTVSTRSTKTMGKARISLVVAAGSATGYAIITNQPESLLLLTAFALTCRAVWRHLRSAKSERLKWKQTVAVVLISPPQLATWLLCLFLPKADRDNIIGDMDEHFPKWVERHGLRTARLLYVKDACTMIYPAVAKLIVKLASITGLGEIIRRFHWW